jgi:siroheme decarboxylase
MSSLELDTTDRGILAALQGDLGGSPEPYRKIAESMNIPEDEVIGRIKSMLDQGVIRRIGAMIRHIEAGIGFNGMIVWNAEPSRIEEVGLALAGFPEVSHCYKRPPFGVYGGTLFTMIHASSEQECRNIVGRMAEEIGVAEYEVLLSTRELKKISMTYFEET